MRTTAARAQPLEQTRTLSSASWEGTITVLSLVLLKSVLLPISHCLCPAPPPPACRQSPSVPCVLSGHTAQASEWPGR